jgi:hypothetical protein
MSLIVVYTNNWRTNFIKVLLKEKKELLALGAAGFSSVTMFKDGYSAFNAS